VSKKVGHRFLLKKIHVRVEHVTHSTSRDEFLARMKRNDESKRAAKLAGLPKPDTKRQPKGPIPAHFISTKKNTPELVTPVMFEFVE